MSEAPKSAPKCCPRCGADIMPVGENKLCWHCREPLPAELLVFKEPPQENPSPSIPGESPKDPQHRRTWTGLWGSVVICIFLSASLLTLRHASGFSSDPFILFFFILVTGLILAGPGLLILSYILMAALRRYGVNLSEHAQRVGLIFWGALCGPLLSALNFPGYLGILHLQRDPHSVVTLVLLYALNGALCGAWIGWQVFKERHPGQGFLPPIRSWGWIAMGLAAFGILWLFQPVFR